MCRRRDVETRASFVDAHFLTASNRRIVKYFKKKKCTVRLNAEGGRNGTMNRNNNIKISLSLTIIIASHASFVQK